MHACDNNIGPLTEIFFCHSVTSSVETCIKYFVNCQICWLERSTSSTSIPARKMAYTKEKTIEPVDNVELAHLNDILGSTFNELLP